MGQVVQKSREGSETGHDELLEKLAVNREH